MILPLKEIELIETKSKFIGYIFHLDSIDQVNLIIDELKVKHKKYSHVVYAYIINGVELSNDDGEPKNTAGYPSLYCLQKSLLTSHLICIVRYFGGVKLGASKLTKTYRKVASNLVNLVKAD